MAGANVWDRFPLDPRAEQHARLRAADRDRDIVNEVLGSAYAEGRLAPEELDERSSAVARAKTLGELPALLEDLVLPDGPAAAPSSRPLAGRRAAGSVSPHHEQAERRYRVLRLVTLMVFLVPTLICWVVWGTLNLFDAGTTFPWPIFPTMGTSIPLFVVLAAHRDIVSGSEHHLERREIRRRNRELPPPPTP